MSTPPTILTTILVKKAEEVARRRHAMPISALEEIASGVEKPRGFYQALLSKVALKDSAIIAEIKKASPSQGVIREHFNPVSIAQDYARNGATCLSVLTDKDFFQGSEAYLEMVRKFCPLPVLRKDFMIDPYQIYESHALGADCILLIVAALEDSVLHDLASLAKQLGMDVLIEVHNQPELERALRVETPLIGINNRDLHTFNTSLNTSIELQSLVPADRLLITESGVHTIEDVKKMHAHGIHAFLIGEAFMRADSPGQKLRELFTH